CFEDIKENKSTICKIHETINTTDEEIAHYCKHSNEIKDNCSKIFEKDEHVLVLNKIPQSTQLFLPYESQKFARPKKMHSSEPRVTDKKEESSVQQSKIANIDFRQKENDSQVFNDSGVNNHSKYSHVTAIKSSQSFMQFRLLTPQKRSNSNQWFEKGHTGNLFGKPEEDTFTFSFSSDTSAHTFGTGKDDFSFPFSFEQDQTIPSSSLKGFTSSQDTTQFTFF
ncbi:Protein SIX6OS1, partial [Sciurus carolinensis]|nr:Protein SIX6OS1 [Sciurus carolinensis]